MFLNKSERLGFSDLTEDEGFLIVLYRDWRSRGPTRAVGEHALANLLKADRIYTSLGRVFAAFRSVEIQHRDEPSDEIILTEQEEALLTDLSEIFRPKPNDEPNEPEITVRPASEIFRSGHDRVHGKIELSYWQTVLAHVVQT